jgi:hypothetical protein
MTENQFIGFTIFWYVILIGLLIDTTIERDKYFYEYLDDRSCRYELRSHITYLKAPERSKKIWEDINKCYADPYQKGCKCEGYENK